MPGKRLMEVFDCKLVSFAIRRGSRLSIGQGANHLSLFIKHFLYLNEHAVVEVTLFGQRFYVLPIRHIEVYFIENDKSFWRGLTATVRPHFRVCRGCSSSGRLVGVAVMSDCPRERERC